MGISVKYMAHSQNTRKWLINKKVSCYGCIYLTEDKKCNWFYQNGQGWAKPVPKYVLPKGCKKREGVKRKGTDIVQYIIDRFEGEIVG